MFPSGLILKIMRDSLGGVARYKARLVVRGNFQADGDGYAALYEPVACIELVRVMLSIAVAKRWEVDHLDVKGALLHSELPEHEKSCVKLPKVPEFTTLDGRLVMLLKSLYGIRKAPMLWYQLLEKTLGRLGFRRAKHVDCLMIGGTRSTPVFIVAYVDDLLVIGVRRNVASAKLKISENFTVTDVGPCTYLLGMKIERRHDGLFSSQSSYARRIVEEARMTDCLSTSHCL